MNKSDSLTKLIGRIVYFVRPKKINFNYDFITPPQDTGFYEMVSSEITSVHCYKDEIYVDLSDKSEPLKFDALSFTPEEAIKKELNLITTIKNDEIRRANYFYKERTNAIHKLVEEMKGGEPDGKSKR